MKRNIALLVVLCLVAGGCASLTAAYKNMTPAQKARYSINLAYVAATEAINLASVFVDNQEDLDKIRAKIEEIAVQVNSSVNVILALIPPGMDGVAEYAQDKIDSLNADLDALEDKGELQPIEPDD